MVNSEGKGVTNPDLDLEDFVGLSFTTGPDKKLYQLPDQQFANLYWFRQDWFSDDKNKADFKTKYGYDLGVPVNWSADEDIAEFFTGREINGKSQPVGSCIARGGATNSPAAVYTIQKYIDWLKAYAPPAAAGMVFGETGPVPAQGEIAQQMFWYTAFAADMVKEGLPVVNEDGTPKWRMAPSPHGAYWQEGMKVGYQDAGSWTLMKSTPVKRAKAAWLYAQLVVSKTVDLKKSKEALDALCEAQEKVLIRLERAGVQGDIGPKMNDEKDPKEWLAMEGAPKAKMENEKPKPMTVDYDELIKSWQK